MAIAQQLGPSERERLSQALLAGYPTRARLGELLDFGLDKKLDEYPGGIREAIRLLIEDFNANDQIWRLVTEAARRSMNLSIRAFHDEYFRYDTLGAGGGAFEAMVTDLGFASFGAWLDQANAIRRQVCRIEVPTGVGTGFLVGADLVLTNYHVIESARTERPSSLVLRFDLTATASAGSVRELASDWLVDESPYSPTDLEPRPVPAATETQLDYAILRTRTPVGDDEVDGAARGWQTLRSDAASGKIGAPLLIVQHPEGEHLRLAVDTNAVVSVGPTRIRYRTNTKPGSSGSPCFDMAWNLLALHHSGHVSFRPAWNEGIPISAIARAARQITSRES